METVSLPSFFVPHGAPTFALRPGAAGAALAAAAAGLPRPRAIIVINPHWDTREITVGFAERPETIHDFSGFPEELYFLRYPATGCREASAEALQAFVQAGFEAKPDVERGLDHGAWIPLRLMFPEADIPVFQISIQSRLGPEHHYRVGRVLAPLAKKGFLVIASGSLTHNLSDYFKVAMTGGRTPDYVRAFSDWVWEKLRERDLGSLLDYRRQAKDAVFAHPSEEHLLPLFAALGVAGKNAKAQRLHAGIDDYVIAMDAFAFHPVFG